LQRDERFGGKRFPDGQPAVTPKTSGSPRVLQDKAKKGILRIGRA
jgi:hypothetical protein